jgi:hypothetical protein
MTTQTNTKCIKETKTKVMIERYSTMRDMSAILRYRECAKGDEATAGHKVEETQATPNFMRQFAGPLCEPIQQEARV